MLTKNNLSLFLYIQFLFCLNILYSQEKYYSYIDSADLYVDESPKLASKFLDSIPEPVQTNVKGRLAHYYQLRALVNNKHSERAKLYNNFLLTLKYAKIEKNHDIAGMACIELFYNIYLTKQDTSDYKYLDEAEKYFTLSKNIHGLMDVKQMYPYIKFNEKKYEESNQLILKDLETYKNTEDDAYYYMYALFLLSSNYIYLNDFEKAHKYFYHLKKVKQNKTISPSLHSLHVVALYGSLAEVHLKNKRADSTFVYLTKSSQLRKHMNSCDTRQYFNTYIDYFDYSENIEEKKSYIDSLRHFEEKELSKIADATVEINQVLQETENQLNNEESKKNLNRKWIALLFIALVFISFLFFNYYKKIKIKLTDFTKRVSEYSYLKTNHDKLKIKIHGLEEYIVSLKKEIKDISSISDNNNQRNKIKDLYTDIHLNSISILDKSENHLELINDLNIDFFNQISTKYPQLNSSEIIICYYIFTGFKNKEIAIFLNTSDRSIESKRYRISKKLDLQDKDFTLADYLEQFVPQEI